MKNKTKQLENFIQRNLPAFEDSESLLEAMAMLADKISSELNDFNEIDAVFTRLNKKDIWVACHDCGSPVLLEYKNCNFCNADLLTVDVEKDVVEIDVEKDVVEIDEEKEVDEDGYDEEVDEIDEEKEVDEVDEIDEEKEVDEIDEEKEVDEIDEEKEVDEDGYDEEGFKDITDTPDEEEEEAIPSSSEINKMRVPGLTNIIREYSLEINVKKYPKTKDLRKVVNKELDVMFPDDDDDVGDVKKVKDIGDDVKVKDIEDDVKVKDIEDDDDFGLNQLSNKFNGDDDLDLDLDQDELDQMDA